MNRANLIFLVPSEFEANFLKPLNINFEIIGVGLVEAGTSCYEIFARLKDPKSVLFFLVGWAGAYPETGLKEGDLVIATKEVWVDFGRKFKDKYQPLPERLGIINSVTFSEEIVNFIFEKLTTYGINPFLGALATVCASSYEVERSFFIKRTYQVLAENMEGFAVARVAQKFGVNLVEIRAITNLLECPEKPWEIEKASKALIEVVKCLKTISQA